jgi:hypothetical protein
MEKATSLAACSSSVLTRVQGMYGILTHNAPTRTTYVNNKYRGIELASNDDGSAVMCLQGNIASIRIMDRRPQRVGMYQVD